MKMGNYFETKHDAYNLKFKEHEVFEGKLVVVDESDTPFLWLDKETGKVSFGGAYFHLYKEQRLLETLHEFVEAAVNLVNETEGCDHKIAFQRCLQKFDEVEKDFRNKQLKVFRMDDYQWIAHYSEEEALAFYHEQSGVPMDDLKEVFNDWGEVPLTDTMYWEATDITDEEANMAGVEYVGQTAWGDSYSVTFEWVLQNRSHKYPGYIACTES